MIRVVLDTNIVVSAVLRSGSLPESVSNLAMDRRIVQSLYSPLIMAEYEAVLRRPKLDIRLRKIEAALAKYD